MIFATAGYGQFCVTALGITCFGEGLWSPSTSIWLLSLLLRKKRLEETQTLRAGCSNVDQKFRPAADPLPGGAERPKFNQLEMVTTFTYKPSLVRIDARNFELSW